MDLSNYAIKPGGNQNKGAEKQNPSGFKKTTKTRSIAEDVPRHLPGESFIKGPIPFEWMRAAATCGGRGTEVGLLLWYVAGWQRKRPMELSKSICGQFGVHTKTAKRVLVRMAELGLIDAEFHRGRAPRFTLKRLSESPVNTENN
ncbi:hypothetical protein [Novipirellula maiorica]|uniref:hypothetical protein n=1 Tax=Novipirellula maiorica TaxID=1265734 RepID=UPI0005944E3A|nr:hypothetical protein [Rhodopirellula maiorica]